ncbi:type I secretion system permease/ATPase [Maritimibacter sp. UBA3975]|uniref:type I secretion system permease/ATPase n=1 Tax=Maritimibacter sp. UBA3975 TaxID=1946833 RepID=UPI000C090133|nr:type I secretion system permease/ATPase [Maritimibacter sp. UBA3975]MAM63881.1 type I secretion system permease/ATPase [Maritimibacter sp.]|tara:strand:- start:52219 stop:53967 length:1749 start_codon:yes stop_codon:yes gene_type:complete
MSPDKTESGQNELRAILRENRALFWVVGLFSVFVNTLMLTGPIYMLQVYDRVLGSRSEETLLALTVLMAFLFGMMGLLDFVRGRVLARVGAKFQARLDHRVFTAVLEYDSRLNRRSGTTENGLKELEAIRRLLGSPVFAALFDLPFTPIFLAGILLFHPYLGTLALVGGGVLVAIAILNQVSTSAPMRHANQATSQSDNLAEQLRSEAEMVRALGMSDAAFDRWYRERHSALADSVLSTDRSGAYTSLSKTLRMLLQSAILGLGAWLVLQGEVTPGVMIAASILLGRALAPVDLLIGQWPLVQAARRGWRTLAALLSEVEQPVPRTALPRPDAILTAENLTVVPPGMTQAALRMVNFNVQPGEALGIIGPSGAGKSTLARAITGVWQPAGGRLRLDGAALDQFDPATLGQHIGFLPQRVRLFDGTIAENIAGLSLTPDDAKVVEAAKKAAAHDLILRLPDGYDTPVKGAGGLLSGGQLQRIGLARALYGDPVVLVLDEPNANLDNEGSEALNQAVRAVKADGGAVLIMAHRPSAIQECEKLLVLDDGMPRAFGPRDEVLRRTVQNAAQISESSVQRKGGGVA